MKKILYTIGIIAFIALSCYAGKEFIFKEHKQALTQQSLKNSSFEGMSGNWQVSIIQKEKEDIKISIIPAEKVSPPESINFGYIDELKRTNTGIIGYSKTMERYQAAIPAFSTDNHIIKVIIGWGENTEEIELKPSEI